MISSLKLEDAARAAAVEDGVSLLGIATNIKMRPNSTYEIDRSSLRRGKWTPEEEDYSTRLIYEFKNGMLPLADGTTLRTFLSKLLHCDPMRISKKFVGDSCIGKQVFRRKIYDPSDLLMVDEIERTRQELAELERKFHDRLSRSSGKDKSSGSSAAAAAGTAAGTVAVSSSGNSSSSSGGERGAHVLPSLQTFANDTAEYYYNNGAGPGAGAGLGMGVSSSWRFGSQGQGQGIGIGSAGVGDQGRGHMRSHLPQLNYSSHMMPYHSLPSSASGGGGGGGGEMVSGYGYGYNDAGGEGGGGITPAMASGFRPPTSSSSSSMQQQQQQQRRGMPDNWRFLDPSFSSSSSGPASSSIASAAGSYLNSVDGSIDEAVLLGMSDPNRASNSMLFFQQQPAHGDILDPLHPQQQQQQQQQHLLGQQQPHLSGRQSPDGSGLGAGRAPDLLDNVTDYFTAMVGGGGMGGLGYFRDSAVGGGGGGLGGGGLGGGGGANTGLLFDRIPSLDLLVGIEGVQKSGHSQSHSNSDSSSAAVGVGIAGSSADSFTYNSPLLFPWGSPPGRLASGDGTGTAANISNSGGGGGVGLETEAGVGEGSKRYGFYKSNSCPSSFLAPNNNSLYDFTKQLLWPSVSNFGADDLSTGGALVSGSSSGNIEGLNDLSGGSAKYDPFRGLSILQSASSIALDALANETAAAAAAGCGSGSISSSLSSSHLSVQARLDQLRDTTQSATSSGSSATEVKPMTSSDHRHISFVPTATTTSVTATTASASATAAATATATAARLTPSSIVTTAATTTTDVPCQFHGDIDDEAGAEMGEEVEVVQASADVLHAADCSGFEGGLSIDDLDVDSPAVSGGGSRGRWSVENSTESARCATGMVTATSGALQPSMLHLSSIAVLSTSQPFSSQLAGNALTLVRSNDRLEHSNNSGLPVDMVTDVTTGDSSCSGVVDSRKRTWDSMQEQQQ